MEKSLSLKTKDQPFNTRNVVKTLETLMTKVTEKECTAQNVMAACQCAEKITDILKIHLDLFKITSESNKRI